MALSPDISIKELFLQSCQSNDLNKVRYILLLGADVNWRRDDNTGLAGWAGLHWAAGRNYGELLELLLTQTGVNVNITDSNNVTPLMFACALGHENIVRRLSQVVGIEYNCRTVDGLTALHVAVDTNNPRCVEVLRGAGASDDWNVSNDGDYPLTQAVKDGNGDILQTILSVPEPQLDLSVTLYGRNVAQIAVEKDGGDRQRCVELLSQDRRVNWNIKNSAGDTPLMFCLKNNKTHLARCLINTPGVDLDTVDRDGKYLETIARRTKLNGQVLQNICRERDLNILSLVCTANTDNIASRIPECPVCFERFRAQSQVFQCEEGHFVCSSCRPRVETCPTCRGRIMGRCNGFEQFLQTLNI